jgi:5-methylcytosine-specific restriction endonuclease McrA
MGRRKEWPTVKCDHCGTNYEAKPYLANARRFCSASCRNEFRRQCSGVANPRFKRVNRICSICGSGFSVVPSRLTRGTSVYCSMECGREGRRRKIAGKPRRGTDQGSGIRAAKKRDGFACRICGFADVVHGHHIIAKSLGGSNQLDNLITLCPNHHALAHSGHLTVKEMQKAIATPVDLLAYGAAKTVRPRGVLNRRFYRTDVA